MGKSRKAGPRRSDEPIGIVEIDRLSSQPELQLDDYISAASAYVLRHRQVPKGRKKAAQIRLSNLLAQALDVALKRRLRSLGALKVGETKVAGGLRTVNADVSQMDKLDGLRLAIEIKPVNLAVGRAIWNRFGDLRAFAVNIHLKFPFCVVGGVLVIPTVEEIGTKESEEAELLEEVLSVEESADAVQEVKEKGEMANQRTVPAGTVQYRDTTPLIELAVRRLVRARGRKTEADAAHQLEAIAVIAYDPRTGLRRTDLPSEASGLSWERFVEDLAASYEARFE